MKIKSLSHDKIDQFYSFFYNILSKNFDHYTKDTKEYFLKKIYTKDYFRNNLYSSNYHNAFIEIQDNVRAIIIANGGFGGVGFVSWIGVHDEYRDKGLGTHLLDNYESMIKENDGHLIEVYTFPETIKFYEKLGFEIIGVREKGYFKVPNIIMNKSIRSD